MTTLESAFTARASLEMAAFFVTWAAVALLVVIVVHMHVRLQRLELANAPAGRRAAYAHVIGQRLGDLLAEDTSWQPGLMLFVSPSCPTCDRLLDELRDASWSSPLTLVYTTTAAPVTPPLPRAVRILANGAGISAALGIHVTPFAIILGETGIVREAAPVSSVETLRTLGSATGPRRPPLMEGALEEVTP